MLTVVSLFSGAGGLDIGIELAGGKLLAQVEADSDSSETLRMRAQATGADTTIIPSRIEDIDPKALRKQLKLGRGELSLLAGGPPCQPFTTAGLRKAINDSRAASLFPRYLDYLDEFLPQAFVIENVDGLLSAALSHRPLERRGRENQPLRWEERKGSFLYWLLGELVRRDYAVSWGVLEAADYGVPQLRQRAFLVGVQGGQPCFLPPPRYGRAGLPPYRTLREALANVSKIGPVQPLSERKKAVFSQIPPGGNWRFLPNDQQIATMGAAYRATGGKSGWWRRLAWDSPAPTILGMPDHSSTALIHPEDVRCLSVLECAAIQTFPPEMDFGGPPRAQYQQIGNAVPPLLGSEVASTIFCHIAGAAMRFPEPPVWRKVSANRRIGTHGWATLRDGVPCYHILAKVRDDHVWADSSTATTTRIQLAS